MGIGIGIFLIAVGAVLAFAVDAEVSGIDVQTIGVILIIVGALGVLLDLFLFAPRRRTVTETVERPVTPVAPVAAQPVTPVAQAPVVQQPVVEQPVAQAPVAQAPVAPQPGVDDAGRRIQ
jgi:hypothetical protein